jgi:mono/diheme cytochrome c family protein
MVFCLLLLSSFKISAKEIDGKTVFLTNCAGCHGELGDGRGPAAVAIKNPKPRNFLGEALKYGDSKEQIFETITKGVPNTAMPPWSALSVQERRAVASYVYGLVEQTKKEKAAHAEK